MFFFSLVCFLSVLIHGPTLRCWVGMMIFLCYIHRREWPIFPFLFHFLSFSFIFIFYNSDSQNKKKANTKPSGPQSPPTPPAATSTQNT
jgi:hypothetical protein